MTSKSHVFILPGLGNSGPEHWQSFWERNDTLLIRIFQDNWDKPHCSEWIRRLNDELSKVAHPVVFAAHSSACALVAHWALNANKTALDKVKGALLVAPSDPENPNYPDGPTGFGPVPTNTLPFATIVVASSNDIYIEPTKAKSYADAWGGTFVLLENAGHINADSGYGEWSEGYALLESLR